MLTKCYQTDRLALLQSEPQLAPRVLDFYKNNAVFFRQSEPLREGTYYTEEFQRRALARDARNARELRAVRLWLLPGQDVESGPVIGTCGLGNIIFGHFRSAFLHYKLDKDHTGRGYMAEALTELIRIAFKDVELHRLESNIMPRNERSLQLVRRLGFQQEGLARKYLNIGGVWEDHLHMVLLDGEG